MAISVEIFWSGPRWLTGQHYRPYSKSVAKKEVTLYFDIAAKAFVKAGQDVWVFFNRGLTLQYEQSMLVLSPPT